ncbi:fumarylacetoacetate hydrolase family protein [Deinococcus radiophilus]|uniref:2-hydroxyhepta-2,4-diene-1,7-dioate isomerase n=1 Tax=Deinococcus radiophilus TaxID=32062 RepID=A0A431VRZ2_9DEIO|nr:fumarylacetoacetate hydrolase family protein [Deinococcus radiophilus]RTR26018.1 2-hydroxyhepta-2,4-diene-1,7-dioate isomerase [Deinococcus radiophilus]UFA51862.1 fumarylacetoacetate hydrolase family protein [Deinococcus radiophilus]
MKTANFMVGGRTLTGELRQDGLLYDAAGESHNPDDVQFLLPLKPGKVIALALNYGDHVKELGFEKPEEPVMFLKPNTSLLPHGGTVIYPRGAQYMHYECELAIVIGRDARRVKEKDAEDYIGGYTISNDLVVRDYVSNYYRPPMRAKGWDTFGPMGPYFVTKDEIKDPYDLAIRSYVNDELRQEGSTSDMIRRGPELIEFMSRFMTLEAGDVILTGTPKGVSHVHPGDVMRMEVEGLGALVNPVALEDESAEPLIAEEGERK